MQNRTSSSAPRREYLKTAELAEELGLHPITLVNWRREGRGPAFVRFGRAVRYPRAAVEAFAASSMQVPVAA